MLRGHTDGAWSLAFAPDGTSLVSTSSDRTARLWDVTTGIQLAPLRGHADLVRFAAFSPDGAQVVTVGRDQTAKIFPARPSTLLTEACARLRPFPEAAKALRACPP